MKNALLVNPASPVSYWSYTYALEFINRKSNIPPLGLLTVAALFPEDWELRLVDLQVEPLTDAHLEWADVVFTTSMIVQEDSLYEVTERCNAAGVPVVAGGPHPTEFHQELGARFETGGIDHFVLGEAEDLLAELLSDLRAGTARRVYGPPAERPDVGRSPVPRYDLIDPQDYASMALQFSRGCPFDCEFCDITVLFGRRPRTKSSAQIIAELEAILATGWRGSVFLVDDNFIGNKRDAMRMLADLEVWQKQNGFPVCFMTEASVNLAALPDMLAAMRDCGFYMVFLGIESPGEEALRTTSKGQNIGRHESTADYLLRSVRAIQAHGMEVTAGFIIGLDGDKEFDSHLRFIQRAGIPTAMTGLLMVLKGTKLYERLQREARLLRESRGCNTAIELNFEPELPAEWLRSEYRRIIEALYPRSLASYFERCLTLLDHLGPRHHDSRQIQMRELVALLRSLVRQSFSRHGVSYLRFLATVLRRYPGQFAEAIRLSVRGYHLEKVTRHELQVDAFAQLLESERTERRAGRGTLSDGAIARRYERMRRAVDAARRERLDEALDAFHAHAKSLRLDAPELERRA